MDNPIIEDALSRIADTGKREAIRSIIENELNTLTADLATVKKVMTQKNDMFRDGWDELKAENARLREALKEANTIAYETDLSEHSEMSKALIEIEDKTTTALNGGETQKEKDEPK